MAAWVFLGRLQNHLPRWGRRKGQDFRCAWMRLDGAFLSRRRRGFVRTMLYDLSMGLHKKSRRQNGHHELMLEVQLER